MLPTGPAQLTRRRLLTTAAGVPLLLSATACTDDAPAEPPDDPDRDALDAAYAVEAATLTALEGWSGTGAVGALTPVDAREVISAHLTALEAALSASPSGTASQSDSGSPSDTASPSDSGSPELVPTLSTSQVVALFDAATASHTRSLRSASPTISPLLASIAASDATLAAAVRRSS